jgi:hypothetical protein
MNYQAIFLLIILIGGLLLCSFLGGYQCYKEGYTNADCSTDNSTLTGYTFTNTANSNIAIIALDNGRYSIVITDTTGNKIVYQGPDPSSITGSILGVNFQGPDGAFAVIETDSCCNAFIRITHPNQYIERYKQDNAVECKSEINWSSSTSNVPGQCGAMDTTTITTTTFYGPTGGTATITSVDGVYQLKVTDPSGTTTNYVYQSPYTTTDTLEGVVFKGSYGGTARVIYNGNCKVILEITYPSGEIVVYTIQPSSNPPPPPVNTNPPPPPPPSTYPPSSTPANYYPNDGSSSGYNYSSTMPPGIPATQIPPGQEDLYILKSEIVPPVCPVCPAIKESASKNGGKCPPCPACARCPNTSSSDFHCKKVPTYKKNNVNQNDIMPVAVLDDFSTYGM